MKKKLMMLASLLLIFSCETGTGSDEGEKNTGSPINIGSLGIDTHQDNGYNTDSTTHQYEFDIWESGVADSLEFAIYYATDPTITIPENGTYNVDTLSITDTGDMGFYFVTPSLIYRGTSGTVTITNSDSASGTYTIRANNIQATILDLSDNEIGFATFIGTIDVTN